jgi:hypothetical protein
VFKISFGMVSTLLLDQQRKTVKGKILDQCQLLEFLVVGLMTRHGNI